MVHSVTGSEFEKLVQTFFKEKQGLYLRIRMDVPVGLGKKKKNHRFDLGSQSPPIVVECKCHGWTGGGNAPSAKLSIWGEAMLYFLGAPKEFRKIFVVKRSINNEIPLAEHYLKRYGHLVPDDVEIWEFDPITKEGRRVN